MNQLNLNRIKLYTITIALGQMISSARVYTLKVQTLGLLFLQTRQQAIAPHAITTITYALITRRPQAHARAITPRCSR